MSNECDTCTIQSCESPEMDFECWLDMDGTQDAQDLWEQLAKKHVEQTYFEEEI